MVMDQTQDYAIGWGTLALINAGIAQGKNRSGLNWFLLSILFGPIATFALVAFCDNLPPKNRNLTTGIVTDEELKRWIIT